ncbi:hypothetical protein HID58_023166 [Brassica napus]|uniref:MYB transcription factor n=1 Tax=Brassica napus TaxID=3708 RepID=A0ABQ8D1N1_BRANA|nr:telomere repeat-binding factor 2 [Brassica napus]XP_013643293.2 telomere repeat-binding factor 2 [Brassica napus]XP_022572829.2 telomere repeat-binding factor 2 [Brassica napus]XP_048590954.1 telomere repeat-binding factor 2 [Brassica napus]KAH0923148.1 hypothetical protein HID58_023166 [Brassica napus]
MGAPKQKWTPEEEAALKAGVLKHGTGKWRTILSDPQFSSVLKSRSNVDLKDKWRNISVTALWGSRKKAKLALRRNLPAPKQDDNNNTTPLSIVSLANGQERTNPTSPGGFGAGSPQTHASKKSITSLDRIILEAITNLKETRGSDRTSIFLYIEENFKTPPNMKRNVAVRLKHLSSNGPLVKIKHRYRFSTNFTSVGARQKSPQLLLEGNNKKDSPSPEADGEMFMIKGMTSQDAAEAAARAVAEAEFAITEAEEAAKDAERAEAEAEAAQIYAKAAVKALKLRIRNHTW